LISASGIDFSAVINVCSRGERGLLESCPNTNKKEQNRRIKIRMSFFTGPPLERAERFYIEGTPFLCAPNTNDRELRTENRELVTDS
jgi:hypothetical protein